MAHILIRIDIQTNMACISESQYRHTLFYYILLYCALQILQFFTYWRLVATLSWTCLSAPFFQQFMSLCHILVILTIFQTFSLLLYLLWWSVISDLWCHYCNCFGAPQTRPYKTTNLTNVVYVLTAPLTSCSLSLSLSLGFPIPCDTQYWN